LPQEFEFESRKISEREKAVLVGLSSPVLGEDATSDEESLDELEALLETAGGVCVEKLLQRRDAPDPRTFIGKGKASEVRALARDTGAALIVLDNDLAPAQARALEEDTEVRVIDRSGLILDIFAGRARTKEGKLQVELAQYKYVLPRLTGMWTHLVRQTASGGAGPIGTRGPGETQLETDRRHIRRRIQRLEDELSEIRRARTVQRSLRERNRVKVVAMAGYTNSGKSTLLNTLTGAGIPANDRLFDTLDPTTRRLVLPGGREVLFSDTVGFIRKLPHHLIEAFRATLEELTYADVILHIIDVSDPHHENHVKVAEELLRRLGAGSIPTIKVYNKADKADFDMPRDPGSVCISALRGRNIDALLDAITKALDADSENVSLLLPYSVPSLLDRIYREGVVLGTDYLAEGIAVRAVFTAGAPEWVERYRQLS
jgi:GTP-binding protein HflX